MRKSVFSLLIFVLWNAHLLCQVVNEVSPDEAFELTKRADTYLIDVRTIAEYVYVGHPENAYCLPLLFWDEKTQTQVPNDDFLRNLASKFKSEDTLVIICRSGNRSRVAARMAVGAGFQRVFHVTEGFEGKKNEKGYRVIGGWKNRGLPYAYDLKEEYVYR